MVPLTALGAMAGIGCVRASRGLRDGVAASAAAMDGTLPARSSGTAFCRMPCNARIVSGIRARNQRCFEQHCSPRKTCFRKAFIRF